MQNKIDKANAKLDRVHIFRRGNRLSLRATLPPKPGDGIKNKQYTIFPGLTANENGLQLALITAQKIEADLFYDRFSWETDSSLLIVGDAIAFASGMVRFAMTCAVLLKVTLVQLRL